MAWHNLHGWTLVFSLVVTALAPAGWAALADVPAGKGPAPTSQPADQAAIPIETLRSAFEKLQQEAVTAESRNTPAGQAAALAHYRKMHQMLQRFPKLRVDGSDSEGLAAKIEELQVKVADNARQAAARQRAALLARAVRERASMRRPAASTILRDRMEGVILGGPAGGTYRAGRSVSGGSLGGGAVCPPGTVRTGGT